MNIEETLIVLKNMTVLYIESKGVRDGDLYTFDATGEDLILENKIKKKSCALSKAAKLATKCMVKYDILPTLILKIGLPERLHYMKLKDTYGSLFWFRY